MANQHTSAKVQIIMPRALLNEIHDEADRNERSVGGQIRYWCREALAIRRAEEQPATGEET